MRVPVPGEDRRSTLHRVLGVGGFIVFAPMALVVFDRAVTVAGVPLLVVYIFGAWAVGIALTAWLAGAETGRADPAGGAQGGAADGEGGDGTP